MNNFTSLDKALKESSLALSNSIPQPYNEAIYLMMICLDQEIEWVTLNLYSKLDYSDYKRYKSLVKRRLAGEPLAYIRGYQDFWKHKFDVNSSTLIPRPDSETLISSVLAYNKSSTPTILDLGTGSGCLLLSLLSEIQYATGVGVDISNDAIKIATQNAKKLNITNKVQFKNLSWSDLPDEKYDIIISNPPYIKEKDLKTLQKELTYEPINALVSGEDGLECYRSILSKLPSISHNNSLIAFEFGLDQEIELIPLISVSYEILAIEKDLSGISRIIIFKPKQ